MIKSGNECVFVCVIIIISTRVGSCCYETLLLKVVDLIDVDDNNILLIERTHTHTHFNGPPNIESNLFVFLLLLVMPGKASCAHQQTGHRSMLISAEVHVHWLPRIQGGCMHGCKCHQYILDAIAATASSTSII